MRPIVVALAGFGLLTISACMGSAAATSAPTAAVKGAAPTAARVPTAATVPRVSTAPTVLKAPISATDPSAARAPTSATVPRGPTAARVPTSATVPGVPTAPAAPSLERRFTAYLTGYDWWDNTPTGGEISNPVIHTVAGGDGRYASPITLAVGHRISGSTDILDIPEGTRFYVPNLRRYFIVEDTCGDGEAPQDGPCHVGHDGRVWLDLWIDGSADTSGYHDKASACMDAITKNSLVIERPAEGYAVVSGPLFGSACTRQFGDTVTRQ